MRPFPLLIVFKLLLNPAEQEKARVKGLEDIASIIDQCSLSEALYHRRYELAGEQSKTNPDSSHEVYRKRLKELYLEILTFLVTCACFLQRSGAKRFVRDIAKWDEWDNMVEEVKRKETAFKSTEDKWRDLTYQEESEARISQHEAKLRSLGGIESEVVRLQEVIERAQMDADRKSFLCSLTDIQPSVSYNEARKKHGSQTNAWLVEESTEFADWKSSANSLLWIHGKGL